MSILKKAGYLILILLVVAVLLEAALRIIALFPGDSPDYVNDPRLEFRVRPNIDYGPYHTNSLGFNDADRPPQKNRALRVACIGDSYVFGMGVERKDNFVSMLQAACDSLHLDIEVLNTAIPATGPRTYLGLLEEDIPALHADVALVMLYLGNDIINSHPDFGRRVWLGAPREYLLNPWQIGNSIEHSYLFRMCRAVSRQLRQRFSSEPGSTLTQFDYKNFLSVHYWNARIYENPQSNYIRAAYEGLFSLLGQIQKVAGEKNLRLMVILEPSELDVSESLRSTIIDYYGMERSHLDFEQPRRLIADYLQRAGIAFLDLTPAFITGGKNPYYLERDTHWNEKGHRRAAREILTRVLLPMADSLSLHQ